MMQLKMSHFAFAASGTVTLSTGLFQLPTVVAYAGSLNSDRHFFIKVLSDITVQLA